MVRAPAGLRRRLAGALPAAAGAPAALLLHEHLGPLPGWAAAALLAAWAACHLPDSLLTASRPDMMRHETNVAFPAMFARLGRGAVPAHMLLELALAAGVCLAVTGSAAPAGVALAAACLGPAHLQAYRSNLRFLRSRGGRGARGPALPRGPPPAGAG